MKKNKELVIMLTAFLMGQLFQLLFIAAATRLYVAYPVRWCVCAGFITTMLVGLTMLVTVAVTSDTGEHTAAEQKKPTRATPFVPEEDSKVKSLLFGKRPIFDTDDEDIDEIDDNVRKEEEKCV